MTTTHRQNTDYYTENHSIYINIILLPTLRNEMLRLTQKYIKDISFLISWTDVFANVYLGFPLR